MLALEGRISELEETLDKDKDKDIDILLKELDHERAVNQECLELVAQSQAQREAALQRANKIEMQLRELRSQRKKPSHQLADANAELQERLTSLKDARDKLIEALDDQTADAQRISVENTALLRALEESRDVSNCWESQLQEVLRQNTELKNLLEESAQWNAGDGEQLESKLLKSQAKCAELEMHLHALCAELSRATIQSASLHRAIHPIISDIEGRLALLVRTQIEKEKSQQNSK